MRLSPTVLSILAGAALVGCGGAPPATETSSTARTETESIETTTVSTTTASTTTSTPPAQPASAPTPEDEYAVDCGRG